MLVRKDLDLYTVSHTRPAKAQSAIWTMRWLLLLCFGLNSLPLWAVVTSPIAVTDQVTVTYSGLRLNRATNTYDNTASLTNKSSQAIQIPIQLAIRGISVPSVSLANANGALNDGTPYVNVPLGDGTLSPGETVSGVVLKFNNPQKLAFTFTHSVLGVLPSANHPPIANAGNDTSAPVGTVVTLSALNSSDEDGNTLSYRWRLVEKPINSTAQLSNTTSVQSQIGIDRKGSYRIELIVNDDKVDSQPAYVTINTENSKPVAKAGDDQTVKVKQTALLDGGNSSDVDGDPLSYNWELLAKPNTSAASLLNPKTQTPSLTPDLPGSYTVQLKVNDGLLDSLPDQLLINTENSKPVANAGGNQTAQVGDAVTLDGSLSTDVDNDPLSYVWSILSKPVNSTPQLAQHDQVQAILTPDLPGDYVAQLIVNDSKLNSDPATALVTVSAKPVVNHNPQITSSPVTTATVGILYSYNVSATDSDNDTLSYNHSAYPTGMTINSQTGQISWTPAANQTGSQAVSINVSDGKGGSDSQSFSITVNAADQVNVPVLIDQNRTSAEAAIQQAKLNIGTLTFQHDAKADGSVISQSPAAGSSVKIGTVVNLTVSIGPDNGLPPNPATVAPKLDSTVSATLRDSSKFLYTGSNPIQTGVQPGTIEIKRSAVLRGKVLDQQNNPLPGVAVSVKDHPEYGQTLSRADGWFDMAVNGGSALTVNYGKGGYLPAQRTLANVSWQDYTLVDDVALMVKSGKVTTVDLTAAEPMQAAIGTTTTDQAGSRTSVLMIPHGANAQVYNADGSNRPVQQLNLRFTEYSVGPNGPNQMPATLPPTSAYTYALEISADEAGKKIAGTDVLVDQPLPFYVDNFLNLPVGIQVPVAYYDADKAAWIPANDGRVIKIVSIVNGLANLDTDGDGAADNAPGLSITNAEREKLASLYNAGKSLWRVQLAHLSTYDLNYGSGFKNTAKAPDNAAPKSEVIGACQSKVDGSIIGCEGQTLSEEIGLTGTPFYLRYDSDRTNGRRSAFALQVPLSGTDLPPELMRIDLKIDVAGQSFTKNFLAAPNQTTQFEWDGLDVYGHQINDKQNANVEVAYVYPTYYYLPPKIVKSFGLPSGTKIAGDIPTLQDGKLTQRFSVPIGGPVNKSAGLGGWSLSAHHRYDPVAQTLYLGDGSKRDLRNNVTNTSIITTIAGNGSAGFAGDGGSAKDAKLNSPSGVAVGADGSVFVTDYYNHRIRKISPDGIISTIAGTGSTGFSGDNGPAIQAAISSPDGIAVAQDGSVYFVDSGNNRVRRIQPNGIITSVAGNGAKAFSGDGGPATNASLKFSGNVIGGGIAIQADGTLLIADQGNFRVRRVDPAGNILTVAGSGVSGDSGDGQPALAAKFNLEGITVAPDGSIYLMDYLAQRVRRIALDGTITSIAGSGVEGFAGDGGKASAAILDFKASNWYGAHPYFKDGKLYLPDTGNQRVRVIGADNIITTIAGKGSAGFSGDESNPLQAKINAPTGVSVLPDNSIIFTDSLNNRVRKITPLFPGVGLDEYLIPSEDSTQLYRFDSQGRHLETRDALTGNILLIFAYDSQGLLNTITDLDGNVTQIQRDGNGQPTAIVSPYGQKTMLTTDGSGYLSSVANPAGEVFQATYNGDGLLTKFENPRKFSSSMTYDTQGRLIKDTAADNIAQTLARSETAQGYQVTHTSGNGLKTVYGVNQTALGEQLTRQYPDGTSAVTTRKTSGAVTSTAADGTTASSTQAADPRFGMLAPLDESLTLTTGSLSATLNNQRSVTLSDPNDPLTLKTQTDIQTFNGRQTKTVYDATSKTLTQTSPANRSVSATLDAKGRIAQMQVTGIAALLADYDNHGRLQSLSQGSGTDQRAVTYSYNPDGFLASVLDPIGRQLQFAYDPAGRVTTQTLPDGRQILYDYDANGNLTALTPPGRPAHVFHYTAVDQTADYQPPLITANAIDTVYNFDANRALASIERPDGLTLQFDRDNAGRLKALSLQPAAQNLANYAYDADTGKLATLSTVDATLSHTYNGALLTQTSWSGAVSGKVGFGYDNSFRLRSLSLNGANAIAYSYDNDDLLTKAGNLTLTRNSQNGLLTATALGNAIEAYSYNSFAELAGYEAKYGNFSLLKFAYVRDKLGRITQKQETKGGVTTTFDYGYDLAGRLVEVKKNNAVQTSYVYDDNGNRLSRNSGAVTQTGTYDAQDRLLTYAGTSYGYTNNGELKTKTVGAAVTSYDYDVLGNLKKVVLPGGGKIEYLTDGQNRRIGKKVNGSLTQAFLWQGQLQPIAELDGAGNVVSRFVYATGVNVPDYMIKGGNTYRLIKDHLGSPRLVLDIATNTVIQELDYDEFGRVIKDTNPGFQPFGFAGGLYDKDTGLVRFGARDYDASIGRWVSKDPIGFEGGINTYSYTAEDPITNLDSRGTSFYTWCDGKFYCGGILGPIGEAEANIWASIRKGFIWVVNNRYEIRDKLRDKLIDKGIEKVCDLAGIDLLPYTLGGARELIRSTQNWVVLYSGVAAHMDEKENLGNQNKLLACTFNPNPNPSYCNDQSP